MVRLQDDPDFAVGPANDIQKHLSDGLKAAHLQALGTTLAAMYAFIDEWYSSGRVSAPLVNEGELQDLRARCLRYRSLPVEEGSKVGGGELVLFVAGTALVEDKFRRGGGDPSGSSPAAGMQRR